MSALTKYDESLRDYPARGSGLHQHVMRCACLGVIAEIPPLVIIADMEERFVGIKPNEAADAVAKASTTEFDRPESRAPVIEPADIDKFIGDHSKDLMDLMECSPRVMGDPDEDAYTILSTLYQPDEHLFIGDVFDREVKTVREWMDTDLTKYPHIIPNPMTGECGMTDMGKPSFRCEKTVADLRYAVCEMDTVPLDKQVGFWMKCVNIIPVTAIIHSGGKSLHAWVRVNCGTDTEKWDRDVKGWLFDTFGVKYGFDRACSNRARLSRLAGHRRDNGNMQRVIYLGDK